MHMEFAYTRLVNLAPTVCSFFRKTPFTYARGWLAGIKRHRIAAFFIWISERAVLIRAAKTLDYVRTHSRVYALIGSSRRREPQRFGVRAGLHS